MVECDLDIIRGVIQRCIKMRQHGSSLYWADKAVCLSKGDARDVFALAESMLYAGQYHRAIAILSNNEKIREEVYARFLVAQCYCKCNEHQEALNVLENIEFFQQMSDTFSSNSFVVFHPRDGPPSLFDKLDRPQDYEQFRASESDYLPPGISASILNSNIALLKGQLNETLNNLPLAVHWYKEAFRLDPFCYESFEKLTKLEVLSSEDEKLLSKCEASSLSPSFSSMLRALYIDKLPRTNTLYLPCELTAFKDNSDLLVNQAERLLSINHYRRCYSITSKILKNDPYHPDCLPVHVAVLRMLNKSNDLFILSNQLVKIYPESAIAWFATGSYYLTTRKHDLAKRHLRKATQQDRRFGPAWLALGHAYAADNEHDQAIAAYCTAAQIIRRSHMPMMYIGVEYSASSNQSLAENFLQYALQRSPNDPAVLHELGSLAYKAGRFPEALKLFKQAYSSVCELSDQVLAPFWEPLLNNLGHVYRELGEYEEALKMHSAAINLIENSPSTLQSMGLIYAMTHRYEEAIRALQTAISLHSCQGDSKIASGLLELVMEYYSRELYSKRNLVPTLPGCQDDGSSFPGRDISESPPPFPPIVLVQSRKDNPCDVGIPSITLDLDVTYNQQAGGSNPHQSGSQAICEDEDVSMEFT